MFAQRAAWGLGLALVLLFAAVTFYARLHVDRAPGGPPIQVDIPAGATLAQAARRLEEAGALRSAWELRLVARIEGGGRSIKAGAYEIERGLSPASILHKLVAGEVSTIAVTLAEGWTMRQMGQVLGDSLGVERDRFDSLTTVPSRWRDALSLPEGATLEGYLFPETYRFARGVKVDDVVDELVTMSLAVATDSLRERARALGFSWHQALTLASIVEAETSRPDERARVSAVYHNRLREGWKLEADPTVAYALGKVGLPLTYGDLQVDSAYNTYRRAGLPPGPINNPGKASIVAALHPEPRFDAMYFVADGSGAHVFSRTWEEHREAVREYRRMRERGRR